MRVRSRGLIGQSEIDDTPQDDLTYRALRRNRHLNAHSTLAQHTRAKIAPTSRADTGRPRKRRAKRQPERRKMRSGEEDEGVPRGKRKKRKLCTDLSGILPRFLRLSLFLSLSLTTTLSRRLYIGLSAWKGKTIARFPSIRRSSSGPVSRRRRVARSPLRPPRNPRINRPSRWGSQPTAISRLLPMPAATRPDARAPILLLLLLLLFSTSSSSSTASSTRCSESLLQSFSFNRAIISLTRRILFCKFTIIELASTLFIF